ncbi:MAG: HlyD family efflux transporter periplasmic adaptor subunit [Planctomycetota bacterium]
MKQRRLSQRSWPLFCALAVSCAADDRQPQATRARPVTVIELAHASPELPGQLTGIARSYRAEPIGFEVGGRVERVVPVGQEVEGPIMDRDGRVVTKGQVVAQLQDTRYRQAFEVVRRGLEAALKGLRAQEIELEAVAQSDLKQAVARAERAADQVQASEAQQKLSEANFARVKELFASGNASQQDLDRSQAEFDGEVAALAAARQDAVAADAAVASAEANIQLKAANVEQTQAQIAELEQQQVQAQQDLDDCTLTAPFTGRVTAKLVGRGGYVAPGTAVVTLTMMDPIKITATVTPERSRDLLPGAAVAVFPKDLARFTSETVLYGHVFDKPEVADSTTRTYLIDIITRNLRRPEFIVNTEGAVIHTIDKVLPVVFEERQVKGPLFVPIDTLRREGEQDFVYRLPGLQFGGGRSISGVFKPEKLPVRLADASFSILQWSFQRIAEGSDLRQGDVLIVDPQPGYLEGVAVSSFDWAIRPGDIVPLHLNVGRAPPGFYVPAEAIRTLNGDASVFAIGADSIARRVPVSTHETVGMLRRVEGEGLEDGTSVVVDGVHYVADGEAVTVVPKLGK